MIRRMGVVLLTYNRLEYAKRTLATAAANLRTNDTELLWHIASDGDAQDYLVQLSEHVPDMAPSLTNSERGGYGKNYNLAMQQMHQLCEWVLPLEDDWDLTAPLQVDNVIEDMKELDIGCARLGYIGYTQELRGKLAYGSKCGHWLVFDPDSPEPHVFAGHPRVEHVPWSRTVGPWPEGISPGETEFVVAHRPEARRRVAWPLDIIRPSGGLFAHIGAVRSY